MAEEYINVSDAMRDLIYLWTGIIKEASLTSFLMTSCHAWLV